MPEKKYDYLIVGAGLFGATFAYLASRSGAKCLIIDKRPHVGGNLYCEKISDINVHKYGAHIFHTSDKDIWEFVNTLAPFNNFVNSPIANHSGELYNLPFNMNTFYKMWHTRTPDEALAEIERQRNEAKIRLNDHEPSNLEEQALLLVGHDIYEKLIKGYTEKQWGRKCTDLPPFIIRRLPVRLTFDNNYFNDTYQGIPIGGYNTLFERLLQNVEIRLNVNFSELKSIWRQLAKTLVYTGPLDEYFDYKLGKLDWRTVRFETYTLHTANHQGNAVVNYTDADIPYTRIIEHKHFELFGNAVYDNPNTVISKEFPVEYTEGMEPYYPINDNRNDILATKYRELSANEQDVIFGGRLAEYKYYDMAPIIANVFRHFKQ